MPRQSQSQLIGREGEKWFEAQLPPSWIPQRPTEDVGVDYLVVICEDNNLNGLEFRVQVKSKQSWRIRDGNILLPFKRRSLLDIIQGFTPALLVTYETSSKRGYCYWLNQLVGKELSLLSPGPETVTLSLPMSKPIEKALWPTLGHEVRGLSSAIGRRVALAGRSFPVLAFVHSMSEALRGFDFVAHHWENSEVSTQEQKGTLHGMEISCHRDVVKAIKELEMSLPPEFNPILGLDEFAENWIISCEAFVTNFRSLVADNSPDLSEQLMATKVDHECMSGKRLGFVRSILDVQTQVTKLAIGLSADTETHEQESA